MTSRSPARLATLLLAAATPVLLAPLFRATRGVGFSLGAGRRQIRPAAERSAQFDGSSFRNALPSSMLAGGSPARVALAMLTRGSVGKPKGTVPLNAALTAKSASTLAATWLGHATVLLEVDGNRVLTDPVFADRVSPSERWGPRRLHPLPMSPADLPELDAVVISHDHYDHLDVGAIRHLADTQRCPFLVPVGVGAHLRRWGVPVDRIIELDWNEQTAVGTLTVTCTEARHFSGRTLARNTTLWSSWVISGPSHRVFFGGDTGYTPAFAGIGARFGSFDLAVLPIGAYNDAWPDIHMDPEEAVRACGDLGGQLLLPVHWATFDLAFHRWAEPVERLIPAADESGIDLALPTPGQRFELGAPVPRDSWWVPAV